MSPELEQARIGKITASRIKDVLAQGKGITRSKYAAQLAAERMTGKPSRLGFKSASIEHGNEMEAQARIQYEIRNGVMVIESDFVNHPQIINAGMSPDGLVNDDGLFEAKCPDTDTFIEYKLKGEIPRPYRLQMTWQIACSGRKWCDFVAYDPDLPEQDGYLQIRFIPTEQEIKEMELEVIKFDMEVEALIAELKSMREAA